MPLLVRGLERLEYRGYDSAGIAVVGPEGLAVRKSVGAIERLKRRFDLDSLRGSCGLGHTRWATHGAPSDVNAHPHTDCTESIAVVHNGVIRNYASLRAEVEARGHRLRSETDTEVIAHLVEEGFKSTGDMVEALAYALGKLTGSYAIALVTSREPGRIYFARMKSPLILGLGDQGNAVASDIPALLEVTRRVVVVEDGEFGWIEPGRVKLYRMTESGYIEVPEADVLARVKIVEWTPEAASKAGYPHFMIKEIYEQPQALRDTLNGVLEDPAVRAAADAVAGARVVYVAGAGTSYHAGLVFAYMLARMAGRAAVPVVASEAKRYAGAVGEGDVVVAVSQSGETFDTLELVREYKRLGARIVGVTNVVGSALDRESDYTIYTRAGPEIGVAATKTYLSQVLALTLLAVEAGLSTGRLLEGEAAGVRRALERAPEVAAESIKVGDAISRSLSSSMDRRSLYILGRGLGSLLAMEAALKVKEIAYLHAEAYPAGESKHGPIALVEDGFPVFIIATSDSPEVAGNALEMASRGAVVRVFKPSDLELEIPRGAATVYNMPPTGGALVLEPFTLIPPFQLLAYYTAVARGYDPDKPRNLAKTVTVE
ncbi:glutamine--fructose-6-phosphate transaminase (isomerizing) [Stetteria hydrogenophila]